jgi:hypothetical protein
MGKLISAKTISLYQKNTKALFNDLKKEKGVVIVGKGVEALCPNCVYNRVTKSSSGQYNGTGPTPFQAICPVCNGKGKVVTPDSFTIFTPYTEIEPSRTERGNIDVTKLGKDKTRYFEVKGLLSIKKDIVQKILDAEHFMIGDLKLEMAQPPVERGLKTNFVFSVILKTVA